MRGGGGRGDKGDERQGEMVPYRIMRSKGVGEDDDDVKKDVVEEEGVRGCV